MTSSTSSMSWTLPGLQLRDLTFDAPLDHADPTAARIEVFARIVTAPGGEDRPYLVYLQGGPGSEAPRPLEESSPGGSPAPCASTAW